MNPSPNQLASLAVLVKAIELGTLLDVVGSSHNRS